MGASEEFSIKEYIAQLSHEMEAPSEAIPDEDNYVLEDDEELQHEDKPVPEDFNTWQLVVCFIKSAKTEANNYDDST